MATMQGVYTRKVSIDGGKNSQWVATGGGAVVGVIVPSGMASTTLGLDMSIDEGTTAYPVADSTNTNISVTVNSSAKYILFPQTSLVLGAELVRVVTGSNETAKEIYLVLQKVA